jgi:uncharacterized protein YciI
MDVFVHSRGAAGAGQHDDPALDEEHWSYMDRFADGMIARGPTLSADRATWTGSLHILDLPSLQAAERFVEDEPYNRAGLYERHLVRRFHNLLGRTMWQAPRGPDDPRFLVVAQGPPEALPDLAPVPRERAIVHGHLLSPSGRVVGVVLALQAPGRQAVEALVGSRRLGGLDLQIHDWELGGRR